MKERKYLPFTIAKKFDLSYVKHCTADFETCKLADGSDVHVWAWGLCDISNYNFEHGNNINSFIDRIMTDTNVYDIGFHNLKFDGNFLLPAIYKLGYEYLSNEVFLQAWEEGQDLSKKFTHNITSQGQWFSIIIVKETMASSSTPAFVHIWDTMKLFPQTLKEVGQQYCKTYKKIDEPKEFYTRLREPGHEITEEELHYLKNDCLTLAEALNVQLGMYGTLYRTRASKAFDFFKACCTTDDGKTNLYEQHYEGLQQYTIPKVKGLEDWEGAYYRFAPKEIREKLKKLKVKLEPDFEYFIKDAKTWSNFKQAYRGGISFVNPVYQEKDIVDTITVLDVNSMYPYCLRNFPIPFGRFFKHKGKPEKKEGTTWVAQARVSFKLKNEWHLPCIQIKEKYGREWLAESSDYKEYGELDEYNEDVIWFTEIDFETYQENYDFTVHEWFTWYEFRRFSNSDGQKFIDRYYADKQNAERRRNERQEALNNDSALYKQDEEWLKACMDRLEAKVIMNSAYGKHGTKYILLAKESEWQGEDLPIKFTAQKENFNKEPDDPSHYYIPYACFVTAYARRMLVTAWNTFKGKAVYCDTDSLHFIGTMDDIAPELADQVDWLGTGGLGLWKHEGTFQAGRYLRSKAYIEIDKHDKAHVTCAGATKEVKELMNWDTFKIGFNAWDICDRLGLDKTYHCKLKPKQYPSGVDLEAQNFEIRSK